MSAAALERAQSRSIPSTALGLCIGFTALGLVAFLAGLAVDAATAWRAFHVNFLYFAGLAQGGLALAAAFVIVGARWPGPVRRIAEGLAAWVPVTFLLGAVGYFGREHIYVWIENPIPAKQAWLNVPRLFLTNLAIFGIMALVSLAFLRASLRPVLHGLPEEGFAGRMAARWTKGWRGDEAEQEASANRLKVLAPIICLFFAVGYSIVGFDQVMSLSPLWFSNLFGAYFAWGGFLSAVSVTAVLTYLHRDYPGFEGQVTQERFHDLGKMIFAFSIFWMYLFFSQYMIIWYGNLPEETSFFEARLGTQFLQATWYFDSLRIFDEPWVKVSLFAWLCVWVIPFWFLLGQRPKRTGWWLAAVASVSAFGLWVERNVLVWPSLEPLDTWAWLGWIQIGVALGFLGAFALTVLLFTRVFPSLAVPVRR